jgi:GNAT superfamily N-acetyltransferase
VIRVRQLPPAEAESREVEIATRLHDWVEQSITGRDRYPLDVVIARDTAACMTSERGVVLVAEDAGRCVGIAIADLASRPEESAWLSWVSVDPARRREGIGAMLIAVFTALPGVRRAAGVLNPEDPVAAAFWTSRGWRERDAGTQRLYYEAPADVTGPAPTRPS